MNNQQKIIEIGSFKIGLEYPAYFIADIAANHDGDIKRAKKLISLAKEAGANAVKFQHHDVSKYVSDKGFKSLGGKFSHQEKWDKSIFEVYKDAEVPLDWTSELKEHSTKENIEFFTTPYDLAMVDKLNEFVPAFKIGSGDIAWDMMLEKIAKQNKPVLFATGASTLEEVIHAHEVLTSINNNVVLMQCNTNYTGSLENFQYINLNVLKTYATLFPNTILGLSDHTPGHETVLGAIALGVKAIEKHFTDDTTRPGPDHPFSMDPKTWRAMVHSTRLLERSLGNTIKKVEDNEMETVILQRRAVRAIRKINAGEKLTRNLIEFQRPCPSDAMKPNEFQQYIDGTIIEDREEGDYIKTGDISL
jgi:sialic acid synthase SpsE